MKTNENYQISPRWESIDKGLPVRDKKTNPVDVNLDRFITKLGDIEIIEAPKPPPELTIDERRLKLKRQFDYFAQLLIGRRGPFIYTEEIKSLLNQLVDYFMGIECGLDLNKSICLIGEPGRGKSFIMEVWSRALTSIANPDGRYHENREAFTFKRVIELSRELQSDEKAKYETEKLWTRKVTHPKIEGIYFNACLDDIGKEEIEKAYQYGINPMIPIYNARHKIFTRQGIRTHSTTNIGKNDFSMIYSDAMEDRFYEMFNFVELKGESFRRR